MWKTLYAACFVATIVVETSAYIWLPLHCSLPMNVGKGNFAIPLYYFDAGAAQCKKFNYKGSGGNVNRFFFLNSCKSLCLSNGTPSETTTTSRPLPARCTFKMAIGPCRAMLPRFFYDNATGTCRRFNYGGCGGNSNRFLSSSSCERVCLSSNTPSGSTTTSRPLPARCTLKVETGHCRAALPRFYFDAASGTCRRFNYGGCGGNNNRFSSLSNCENICLNN